MSDKTICTCGQGYDPECPWEGHHQPEPVKRYEGHTLGPWVYVNVGEKENCLIIGRLSDENGRSIPQETAQQEIRDDYDCRLYTEGVCEIMFESNDDPQANACLIADAPTLAAKAADYDRDIKALETRCAELEQWLGVVLDQVDYHVKPACLFTEPVGAVLSVGVIEKARAALKGGE